MKRTAVISGFIVITMALALGMSPSSTRYCNPAACITSNLVMASQPYDEIFMYEALYFGQSAPSEQKRPKRPRTSNKQPRERRGAIEAGRPTPAIMVEQLFKEIDPELAEQLRMICETDPEAFEIIIQKHRHRFGSLMRLRKSDPDLFKIKVTEIKTDAEIYYFTEQMRGLDFEAPSIHAQIAQLRGLVRSKTKLSIRAKELYIARLEQHLAGLRSQLDKTILQFDVIVEGRVNQLIMIVRDDKGFAQPQGE